MQFECGQSSFSAAATFFEFMVILFWFYFSIFRLLLFVVAWVTQFLVWILRNIFWQIFLAALFYAFLWYALFFLCKYCTLLCHLFLDFYSPSCFFPACTHCTSKLYSSTCSYILHLISHFIQVSFTTFLHGLRRKSGISPGEINYFHHISAHNPPEIRNFSWGN